MAKSIRTLQQERAKLVDEKAALRTKAQAVLAAAGAAGLTEEQTTAHANYVAAMGVLDKRLALQDDEISEYAASLEKAMAGPVARTSAIEVIDAAAKDPKRGFATPRDFCLAVMSAKGSNIDPRLRPLATAGSDEHSGASDGYGGFLVPTGFSPDLMQVDVESDPTTSAVLQMPMTAPSVKINARTDKNHTSSVSGGLTVSRREQTVAGTGSRMSMDQVQFTAHSLFGVAYATEELLTDSPISFAAVLAAGFQDEFNSRLLLEKIHGTGVGEFRGVLNAPCLVTVSAEGGQTADTINGTNIVKMRKRVWRYGQAIWLANHDTYDQLCAAHIAGTNTDRFLFAPGDAGGDVPDRLLGRPIYFTEYASTLGDVGDLICGTWSQYIQATLQGLQNAESMHVRFLEHERTFKFWMRNDGQPWWLTALTPKKGANTLSPFVTLAAR